MAIQRGLYFFKVYFCRNYHFFAIISLPQFQNWTPPRKNAMHPLDYLLKEEQRTVKQDISADMLFSRFSRLTANPRK